MLVVYAMGCADKANTINKMCNSPWGESLPSRILVDAAGRAGHEKKDKL